MSLFQRVLIWSLRALLAWAVFDIGVTLYGTATQQNAALAAIHAHHGAMARIERRTDQLETALRQAEARLGTGGVGALAAPSESISIDAATNAIAADLLQELTDLGGENAQIETESEALPHSLTRVTLHASWREPSSTSPALINALAAHHPDLLVRVLHLERQGATIAGSADFQTVLRASEARP